MRLEVMGIPWHPGRWHSKGILTAQRLLLDTEPVLITGEGTIDLDSEALDLRFQGRPKHPTLRVRSRLLVRGTLAHPSLSIEAGKPAAQVGGAIALGMLLSPVAAMLAFVDPGLAKDTDCAALLAEAQSGPGKIGPEKNGDNESNRVVSPGARSPPRAPH